MWQQVLAGSSNSIVKTPDTILHIEDDPNDVMLVNLVHRKGAFASQLHSVTDGDEAISYLGGAGIYSDRSRYPFPVVVLLDLKLPRKSGLEVLEWIRAQSHTRRLPVIVLTSSNQPDDIGRAYDLGANSYLVKPGDLEILAAMLKNVNEYWLKLNQRAVMHGSVR
jgi:CheY-like chemotaxis protein